MDIDIYRYWIKYNPDDSYWTNIRNIKECEITYKTPLCVDHLQNDIYYSEYQLQI